VERLRNHLICRQPLIRVLALDAERHCADDDRARAVLAGTMVARPLNARAEETGAATLAPLAFPDVELTATGIFA